jgi:hypothetical protein
MNTAHYNPDLPRETATDRDRRLAYEREALAQAEAEVAAGYYVDGGEVLAWLASLDTARPLPRPNIRRR